MKLRNKKTGEIEELIVVRKVAGCDGRAELEEVCTTLPELNEGWEDYEDQKEDYIRVIDSFIHYVEEADSSFDCDESVHKFVEKLKAWKRLKDKGITFQLDTFRSCIDYKLGLRTLKDDEIIEFGKDLGLLFGGEK